VVVTTFLVALLGPAATCPASPTDSVRIAVLVDGPWDRNEPVLSTFRAELTALLGDEFGVTIPDADVHVADWTLAGIEAGIDAAFADPNVDVVLGLGVLTSNQLIHRERIPKPSIAPFVIDGEVQGAPLANGRSGGHGVGLSRSIFHMYA
jgi:hypothetical protein